MGFQENLTCQYCGVTKLVTMWVPGGNMCAKCKKALDKIRKHKLGFGWLPKVRQ